MFRTLTALLAGAAALPAYAQEAPDTAMTIGDITVTARIDDPLTSRDTLSGEVAQRQQVDDAWEMFARLPGVVLTDFNQGTTSGRFSIRGFSGEGEINAVKLTIDGVPSNDNAGRMDFIDLVAPIDIARIDLARGTADPRWGLHAIAGSADIVTWRGGSYLDLRLSAGAFGTRDMQLAGGVESGRLAQNYILAWRGSDGFRDHADLERLRFAGSWTVALGDASVGATIRHADAAAEEPGYLTDADIDGDRRRSYAVSEADGGTRALSQYVLFVEAEPAPGVALALRGYANGIDDDRHVRFSATVAQQRRLTQERQQGLVASLNWRIADALTLVIGGDVQRQDNRSLRWTTARRTIVAATRDQDFRLTVGGGYAEAIVRPFAALTLRPAWRIDRVGGDFLDRPSGAAAPVNAYGTIHQPKVAAALTPFAGLTAYANYGRPFQIGAGSGAYVVPPRVRDLAPSINTGWEAGMRLTRGGWALRTAAWRQVASGELRRRLNDPAGEFDNLGRTRRDGVDVELAWNPAPGVAAWASWSHQRARIVTPDPATPAQAGNRIDHVPAHVFTGGIEWAPREGPWRASLWGNGQSAYELDPANSQGRYGDFVQLTAEVARSIGRRVEGSVQLRNLANRRYGYVWYDGVQRLHAPADSRAATVALRARW